MYSGVPKRDDQKKRSKFSRFLFWILFLAFLGVCVFMLFFSPYLEIESIAVEGNKDIPSEEIIAKVDEVTGGKYFGYLSKRNILFMSKKQINEKLKSDFNRLEVSAIEKKFPKAVLIKVKERQPEMAWCSGGVCYMVDKEGLVYAGANAADEELEKSRFLIIIDDNAQPVEIRKTTVSPEFIQYMKQVDAILIDGLGLSIDGNYHTPALSSQEVMVKIKEGEGWMLKMSSLISPEDTKKIIETVFDKELPMEKRNNLDYLDLRVKGKVYYKLR